MTYHLLSLIETKEKLMENTFLIIESLDEIKTLLKDKIADRWYDIDEASAYLHLSRSTIYRRIKTGEIKASKKAGKLLFKRSDLDNFLK